MIKPFILFLASMWIIDIGLSSVGGVLLLAASVWLVWEFWIWIEKWKVEKDHE